MVICITVSVNYDNLLEIILPQNHKFFKEWFIVTQPDDTKTIDIVNKYNYSNVKLLYFDFKQNSIFNKGGGIQYALNMVDENENVLLLDSDIYLSDTFQKYTDYQLDSDTLYSFTRYDYYHYDHFKTDVHDSIYPINFMGFFQLFKNNKRYTYANSESCRDCDFIFAGKFSNKVLLDGKVVKHLGKDNVNHFGRKNMNDFLF